MYKSRIQMKSTDLRLPDGKITIGKLKMQIFLFVYLELIYISKIGCFTSNILNCDFHNWRKDIYVDTSIYTSKYLREKKIKTTMRFHLPPLELVLSIRHEKISVGDEEMEPSFTAVENVNWCSHWVKQYVDCSKT